MSTISSFSAKTGNMLRSDDSVINEANILAPQPNGGESLTVSGAGVVALTVPDGTIAMVITNPVLIRVAYGDDTASATVGTEYAAETNPGFKSAEQCEAASVWFSAACTGAYVQYYK